MSASSTSLPALAFAGIGLMGLPMSRRLLAAGYPLKVWNRSLDKCLPLLEQGAERALTPSELCEDAAVVMLCLANTEVVREVVFGPGGIVETARPGQLLVDFSSLEPAATRRVVEEAVLIGEVLAHNIYGVDLNPSSVEIAASTRSKPVGK